jgi:GNAT superfamily N-acetyltransferase
MGELVSDYQVGHDTCVILRASSAAMDVVEKAARRFTGGAGGVTPFVQSPGTVAFVAADDQEIQGWCWGYLLARPDGTSMLYLHNLEVAEPWRRQGIGRRLLRSFRRLANSSALARCSSSRAKATWPHVDCTNRWEQVWRRRGRR